MGAEDFANYVSCYELFFKQMLLLLANKLLFVEQSRERNKNSLASRYIIILVSPPVCFSEKTW